jgi:hypothetical protein
MSANQNVPILFYSERCANSKEVVQTIQALNKASLFRFVCVDTTPRQYIPVEIKSVPTVIHPNTKEMVVGKSAIFAKLSKPVESRREIPQSRPPSTPASTVPAEWSFTSVKSMSTGYSSFDDTTALPDDQLQYSFVNGITTSGQQSILSDSGVSEDTSKRLEQMQSMRDNEFKASARR